MNNEVTKSYEKKYEKLAIEENELKEKLQIEVTKIKEKLENALSELNLIIKTNEKINKGVIALEKEEDKNLIKTLSYVSKINKNKKEMNKIFIELMKNAKILYIEEKSIITFNEYFFNGILIPKNIEIKDIYSDSIKVFWTIDNIKFINIDKKEIQYKVEIKKENENYKQVYEGEKDSCVINRLEKNINYEIRICLIYNNSCGLWSNKKEIKFEGTVESRILSDSKRGDEFLKYIPI